jgi:hypothetical protein
MHDDLVHCMRMVVQSQRCFRLAGDLLVPGILSHGICRKNVAISSAPPTLQDESKVCSHAVCACTLHGNDCAFGHAWTGKLFCQGFILMQNLQKSGAVGYKGFYF